MEDSASEDVSGWWFLPGGCLFSIYPVPGLVLDIGCTMVNKRPWKWAFSEGGVWLPEHLGRRAPNCTLAARPPCSDPGAPANLGSWPGSLVPGSPHALAFAPVGPHPCVSLNTLALFPPLVFT